MKKLRHLAAALAMVVSLGIMVCGCSSGGTGGEPSAPSQTVTISKDKELSVHFIDVGQADCILIQTPDKKNILIDAGNRDDSSLIQKYLKNQQVDTLDLMVLTHPHEDHIGSAANIIKTYSPAQICMPDAMSTSQVFEKTLNAIVESKCELLPAKPGTVLLDTGDVRLEVAAPNSDGYDSLNDYSVVTRLSYGSRSFLLTGDAQEISEKEMLDAGAALKSDVLKVGHHGSTTSTSEAFLKAVSPEFAVISCETGNEYGHPHKEILERLEGAGVTILRTDTQGTVIMRTDGKQLGYETLGSQGGSDGASAGNSAQSASESSSQASDSQQAYVGNKNSKVFHTQECDNNMAEKNKVFFDTRQQAVDAGYSPCSRCNP